MIVKLASITIPNSHLKEDHKDLEFIKKNTKGLYHILAMPVRGINLIGESTGINKHIKAIIETIKEMEADDQKAIKNFKTKR